MRAFDLLELFLVFLKIGAFTFGGGYAMLPLVQEAVLAHNWLTEAEIVDFIAVSESTPGPFAVNMATYVGSQVGGILGAAIATLGVVLPSFIVILIIARCYLKFKQSKIVSGCMRGLKPAVIGMIGAAAISIASTVFFPGGLTASVLTAPTFYVSLGILAVSLLLSFKKVHPIVVILLSAAVGIGSGYLLPLLGAA